MIIDSSAIVAVLRREPESDRFVDVIGRAPDRRMSAASYLESAIVIDSDRDAVLSRELDEFLGASEIRVEAVTVAQAEVARAAYRDFGKGSGHPAQLNLGDCFAYALAVTTREPLLYKGNDFGHTGIRPALPGS